MIWLRDVRCRLRSASAFFFALWLVLGFGSAVELWSGLCGSARAALKVDITEGFFDPLPIAIADFQSASARERDIGRNVRGLIEADLRRSGFFRPIDKSMFPEAASTSFAEVPGFEDWRLINVQALSTGRVSVEGGTLKVEFRLWDVFSSKQIAGFRYEAQTKDWRSVGHMIADVVYHRLTGAEGYFHTRIVYVSESGLQHRSTKRLAMMDQDGANHRFLTSSESIVFTPRFSPSGRQIVYVAYRRTGGVTAAGVYLQDLTADGFTTGKFRSLPEISEGEIAGATFAPRFSRDGRKLIFSMSRRGNTDLYVLDLRTSSQRRLTTNPSIDTSASYSPDSRYIVFNSDRGGTPQLYVMRSDGNGPVQRISWKEGIYQSPVWSPQGDRIAFVRMHEGSSYIGVMRPDGSEERTLVRDYDVEGPEWSPNGRVLLFFRKSRADREGRFRSRLHAINRNGYNERELPTPQDASDPAWSFSLQ